MKQQLNGDWAQKLLTSRRTVLGLSAAAGLTGLLAYESAKITDDTRNSLEETTVVSQDESGSENGTELESVQIDKHPLNPGVVLAYSGSEMGYHMGYQGRSRVVLGKEGSFNVSTNSGGSYLVSRDYEPEASSCDNICEEARKTILSCFEENGCDAVYFKEATETLSRYPHRQKL